MADITGTQTHASTAPTRRWRRPLVRGGIALLVLAVAFYGGGGWYFASQLGDDAFVVDHSSEDEYTLEVVAIDPISITLSVAEGDEPTLGAPGVTGFNYPGGWLRLAEVTANRNDGTNEVVTRSYTVIDGSAPKIGDFGDLDSWLFPDDPRSLFENAEDVVFDSELGPMDAWYVPGEGDMWVILAHGKGATRRETLRMMTEMGSLPMLSIAYRNDEDQPADPSGYYRYGTTEWRDIEAAVRWSLEQGAEDVVLVGFSTGAALDLAFMYRSELANHVGGLILDAPNIDFGRAVDYGASQRTLPLIGLQVPQSLTTAARFIGALRFDVDWSELDYIDNIDQLEVPMLVLHGSGDDTVPVDVSERLAQGRPDLVTLVVFDGAEHVQSWNAESVQYGRHVRRFVGGL